MALPKRWSRCANTWQLDGETVVQLYGRDAIAPPPAAELELLGFARITVPQGQRRTVRFRFNLNQMAFRTNTVSGT